MNMIIRKQLQLKAKEKKGFTLVEVIVVLVILAILMAIAIPALTGYIDRANDRAALSEGRNVQMALQTIGSNAYADPSQTMPTAAGGVAWTTSLSGTGTTAPTFQSEITQLTKMTFHTGANVTGIQYDASGNIVAFNFVLGSGKTVGFTTAKGLHIV